MIKKKAKKRTAKKATKRVAKAKRKDLNPAEVRKDIAAKVEAQADDLADAVIEEGKKGQLATVKYLFEMAHIFPEVLAADAEEGEESLAETLLKKLGVPQEPVVHEQYERGEDIVIAPRREVTVEGEAAESETQTEAEVVTAE